MKSLAEIINLITDQGDKLDPAVKEKWLTALRSNNYGQTTGWLSRNGGFCCLGVLASCQGIPSDDYTNFEDTISRFIFNGAPVDCMLPDGSFGLSESTMDSLAELNDEYKMTFAEIADIIEEHL